MLLTMIFGREKLLHWNAIFTLWEMEILGLGRDGEREGFGEVVQSFKYLGANITNVGSCAENVRLRIIAATASMAWQ